MRPGCVINEAKANYEACVYVTIDNIDYKLNGDTKLEGVKTFLENKYNDLVLIANRNGNKNKLVNTKNGAPIPGFYMCKLFY